MSIDDALLEPTFVDAIGLIEGADELPAATRTHWVCSLRQIAKALDKPLEVIPARYSAIRSHLRNLHHAPLGLTAKTLANHKSNAKAGLLWLANERSVPPPRGALKPRMGAPVCPVVGRADALPAVCVDAVLFGPEDSPCSGR